MRGKYDKLLMLAVCVTGLAGCQWLREMDAGRTLEFARADHANCAARGYDWPGAAYVDCRRFLQDARQREQWQELQMARQQQQPEVGITPRSPVEPYRPIREENFRCTEAAAVGGGMYISCGEGGR